MRMGPYPLQIVNRSRHIIWLLCNQTPQQRIDACFACWPCTRKTVICTVKRSHQRKLRRLRTCFCTPWIHGPSVRETCGKLRWVYIYIYMHVYIYILYLYIIYTCVYIYVCVILLIISLLGMFSSVDPYHFKSIRFCCYVICLVVLLNIRTPFPW